MIVRLMGEGQFELAEDDVAELNLLDVALDADLDEDGAERLGEHLARMHAFVRERGTP
ncbi:MAG: PspA-associated protein PspAA, partial [Hyphomicrobiales bacterium]